MNQAYEFLKGKIWELVVWRALGKPLAKACGWPQHLTPGLGVLKLNFNASISVKPTKILSSYLPSPYWPNQLQES